MTKVIVGKWGKSLAIRLPSDIAKAVGLSDGERVEVAAQQDSIIVRRTVPRFTLDELFEGKTPEQWRAAYKDAFDWGADRGREVVEE
jgi:antitoxin MazE